jgi:phage terminase large subunit GpA-like protein
MFKAEFICTCGLIFYETLLESEVSKEEDFERFYVRCPRCGEEVTLRSLGGSGENGIQRRRDAP